MACKNVCRICDHLAISEAVAFTGGNLVITLPENSYRNGEKVCIVVAQTIPEETTITAPVVIQIGAGTEQYPLTNRCCGAVTACGIRTRTRYTIRNAIRTHGRRFFRKFIGKILRQIITEITFRVVDDDPEMIVVDINGINKRLNQMLAVQRIVPVAFGEAMQEEDNAVAVHQLGLGKAEGFDGDAEIFRGGFQRLQLFDRRGRPNTGGDCIIDIINLFFDFGLLGFHGSQRGGLQLLRLEGHDGIRILFDHFIREDIIQDEINHGILQAILPDGLLRAALPGFMRLAGIIIEPAAGLRGTGIADHGGPAMAAERLTRQQEINGSLLDMAGGFLFHSLGLLKSFLVDDGGHPVRDADGSPDIRAGIALIRQDPHEGLRSEGLPAGGFHSLGV